MGRKIEPEQEEESARLSSLVVLPLPCCFTVDATGEEQTSSSSLNSSFHAAVVSVLLHIGEGLFVRGKCNRSGSLDDSSRQFGPRTATQQIPKRFETFRLSKKPLQLVDVPFTRVHTYVIQLRARVVREERYAPTREDVRYP